MLFLFFAMTVVSHYPTIGLSNNCQVLLIGATAGLALNCIPNMEVIFDSLPYQIISSSSTFDEFKWWQPIQLKKDFIPYNISDGEVTQEVSLYGGIFPTILKSTFKGNFIHIANTNYLIGIFEKLDRNGDRVYRGFSPEIFSSTIIATYQSTTSIEKLITHVMSSDILEDPKTFVKGLLFDEIIVKTREHLESKDRLCQILVELVAQKYSFDPNIKVSDDGKEVMFNITPQYLKELVEGRCSNYFLFFDGLRLYYEDLSNMGYNDVLLAPKEIKDQIIGMFTDELVSTEQLEWMQ
jgi:hypothetical protein